MLILSKIIEKPIGLNTTKKIYINVIVI